MSRRQSSAGAGVLLVSLALMATEVLLTRVFSVVVWYHFAFFAISVALFGTSAGALVVHFGAPRAADGSSEPATTLPRLSLGLAASVLLVDLALVHATPWLGGALGTRLTAKLLALFLLASLPFFVGGWITALVFARHPSALNRLYFADLLGAGLACGLLVPATGALGAPRALVVAAACAALAAAVFVRAHDDARVRRRVTTLASAAVAALALATLTGRATGLFDVRFAKGIDLTKARVEYEGWTASTSVAVLPLEGFRGWGTSPRYAGPIPDQRAVLIDMNAMTPLTRFDGDLGEVRYVAADLSAFVYQLRPHAQRVAVLGAGGGKDVLAALASGAASVDAVELNPLIVDQLVRGEYRQFTGGLYDRPDVRPIVEDGRAFAHAGARRFDVLQVAMVDTSAASAAGAYALTENGLYTDAAFAEFLSRLDDGGWFSVASASMPETAIGARLATTARAALRRLGRDPLRSLAVVETPWLGVPGAQMYNVLVKPSGMTDDDVERLERAARALGFTVTAAPSRAPPAGSLRPEQALIARVVSEPNDDALARDLAAFPLDVTPPTDDRPFLFYQNRLRDFPRALAGDPAHLFGNGLPFLAKLLVLVTALVTLLVLLPVLFRRAPVTPALGPAHVDAAFAVVVSLGFMCFEIAMLQQYGLLLGDPTVTLAVVLAVTLVACGVGSRTLGGASPSRVRLAMAGLVVYALLLGFASGPLVQAGRLLGLPGRAALAALTVAPLGFLMGVPFSAALAAIGARAPSRVPWIWSVNGAASVLGSTLATLLVLHAGVRATWAAGACLYLAALGLAALTLRRDARSCDVR